MATTRSPHYAVPNSWNFSRFLSNLIAVETEQGLVSRMLIDLREQLMGDYGRIVRIDITEQNRRIFVPTPHGSPSWQRGYARRSALERINNRIDNSFCFEKHFIRGQAKMKTLWGWRWQL